MTDYYALLKRVVQDSKNPGPEARRAIYERARNALMSNLRARELTKSEIQRESAALDEAVSRLEREIDAQELGGRAEQVSFRTPESSTADRALESPAKQERVSEAENLAEAGSSLVPLAPKVLAQSDQAQAMIAILFGLAAAAVTSISCYLAGSNWPMLSRAFNPYDLHSAIPFAIFFFFFWGLAICVQRWRYLGALRRISDKSLMFEAISILGSADGPHALRKALEAPSVRFSPLLRRLKFVMEQWALSPGLQDTVVILDNQIALDAEGTSRSYGIVRVMVWALPVLGLVGTVLGIADAVGGFSNFLGQDISEVGQIRLKLVEVTSGLSFSFLITLQGLVTSIILMVFSSMLQSREGELFSDVQKVVAETFLPAVQSLTPATLSSDDRTIRDIMRKIHSTLKTETQQLVNAVERTAATTLQALEKQSEYGAQAIALMSGAHSLVERLALSFEAVSTAMANLRDPEAKRVGEEMLKCMEKTNALLEGFSHPFVLQAVPIGERRKT
jgi:biopolymer transport protein ExbB/TolQ